MQSLIWPGISKPEPHDHIHGTHGSRRDGQTVVSGVDYRIDVGIVDLIQEVVGFEAKFQAATRIAELETAPEAGVQSYQPWTGNGVAAGVAELTGRRHGKCREVKKAATGENRRAGSLCAPASDAAS